HAATRARADELSDRLEGLLAQLDVGVFSCTTDGDLLEVNDALVRLLGCQSIDEVRRTEFAEFLARHSASSADAHHPDQPPGRHHAEIRVQRSPGEYRTL